MERKRWARPGELFETDTACAPDPASGPAPATAPATAAATTAPMMGERAMSHANTGVNTRIDGASRLCESRFAYNLSAHWCAGTLAASGLKSLALRPKDSPSGDSAGRPTTPLLGKEAETSAGEM